VLGPLGQLRELVRCSVTLPSRMVNVL